MSIEEMQRVMSKPKSITYQDQYRKIYKQLTGKDITGCLGCKLTWLYNTNKLLLTKLN